MTLKQTDCFKINVKFWRFLGMWADENSKYYKYYRNIFLTFFFIAYVIFSTINFYFLPRDIHVFVEEMVFYFTEYAIISKALTFLFKREEIKDTFDTLESDMFQPETDDALKIVERAKKLVKRYYKVIAIVSYTANLTHIISPLIAHIFFSVKLYLPLCSYSFISESIKEMFIYPLYFYQCVGSHFFMLVNVNTNSYLCGLMILGIAQLEVLDYNLRRVTDSDITGEYCGTDKEEVLKRKLRNCILHFSEINRFCRLIEKAFSTALFVQLSAASCVICVSLFRFTLPAPMSYYVFLTTYMIAMTEQILMPCWFGNRIMETSSSLSVAIYNCKWTLRSRHFKSNMIIFVQRMNRPLSVTGLKMFPLLLTTFTTIMNTAYSFYTLLRNMQN